MPQDPSNIAGAEHAVSRPSVEDSSHGVVQKYSSASMVPDDAFGFACGSTRVEDVERMGGGHDDGGGFVAGVLDLKEVVLAGFEGLGFEDVLALVDDFGESGVVGDG